MGFAVDAFEQTINHHSPLDLCHIYPNYTSLGNQGFHDAVPTGARSVGLVDYLYNFIIMYRCSSELYTSRLSKEVK